MGLRRIGGKNRDLDEMDSQYDQFYGGQKTGRRYLMVEDAVHLYQILYLLANGDCDGNSLF